MIWSVNTIMTLSLMPIFLGNSWNTKENITHCEHTVEEWLALLPFSLKNSYETLTSVSSVQYEKCVLLFFFFVLKKIMLLNAKYLKNRKQRNHILDASKMQSGINKVHKKKNKKKLILLLIFLLILKWPAKAGMLNSFGLTVTYSMIRCQLGQTSTIMT